MDWVLDWVKVQVDTGLAAEDMLVVCIVVQKPGYFEEGMQLPGRFVVHVAVVMMRRSRIEDYSAE